MRALCVSDRYCQYKTDTGYCGYTGCGCALDSTITIRQPKDQSFRDVRLVDISTESINQIADAVVRRLREVTKRWIPCSEGLPKEKDAGILKKLGTNKRSDYVIATVEVKGERMTVTACTHDGKWDWNMKYAFPDFKVIAWMPLPEPYKEVTE